MDVVYREERNRLLDYITKTLTRDERVVAAWLAGSLGRSNADDLSDIDLWVVVRDDRIGEIVDAPVDFVHGITPTLMEIAAPANAPVNGAYLLTWIAGTSGPQQVDWYWQAASTATRPPNTTVVFERLPIPVAPSIQPLGETEFVEHLSLWIRESLLMAFIASKHIRRDDPWVVSQHFGHVGRCVGTVEWLLDHGHLPVFDDPIDLHLPESIPTDASEQLTWIQASLRRLVDRVSREQSALLADHEAAVDHLNQWLNHVAETNV